MVPVLIPVSHIIRTKNPHVNETRKPVPGPVLENIISGSSSNSEKFRSSSY